MIEIHLEPNDKADIIELLEYALKKKTEEDETYASWKMSNYWKIRIPQLMELVGGKNPHDLIQRSTSGYQIKRGE